MQPVSTLAREKCLWPYLHQTSGFVCEGDYPSHNRHIQCSLPDITVRQSKSLNWDRILLYLCYQWFRPGPMLVRVLLR